MAEKTLMDEIKRTIESLDYGSIEVIVQGGEVTQISTRIIKKTNIKSPGKIVERMQKSSKDGINLNFKY